MKSNLRAKACITHEVVAATLEGSATYESGDGITRMVLQEYPVTLQVRVCQVCGALFHPDYLPGE